MTAGHDLAPLRATLTAEWSVIREWIGGIPSEAYDRPSVLDGWTVRDLIAHLAPGIRVLAATSKPETGTEPLGVAAYVGTYPVNADGIAESTRSLAARTDDVTGLLDEAWAEVSAWLADAGEDGRRVVQARRGPIRLDELVRTRLLEIVVHGDDLARSVPELAPPAHDRGALRDVVKSLLAVLVERAPGRSVEVRVPPFAAVQVIEGTSHTRGTPPNTVETDPLTWIRIACGRQTWSEAGIDVRPT